MISETLTLNTLIRLKDQLVSFAAISTNLSELSLSPSVDAPLATYNITVETVSSDG